MIDQDPETFYYCPFPRETGVPDTHAVGGLLLQTGDPQPHREDT